MVYVLQSRSTGDIYIGQTEALDVRVQQHNDPDFRGTLHTKRRKGPWALIHSESLETRGEAIRRERQLKSSAGRRWIKETLLGAGGC